MFHTASSRRPNSVRSLALSAAIHSATLFVAMSVPLATKMAERRAPLRRTITYLAPATPVRPAVTPRVPVHTPAPALHRTAASQPFRPPSIPKPVPPRAAIEIPQAPVITTQASATLPQPKLTIPQLAPPIKTGTFEETLRDVPAPAERRVIQANGFPGAEISSAEGPSRAALNLGAFDPDSKDASNGATYRKTANTGGFGDATVALGPSRRARTTAESTGTPVEIIFKPRPVYTGEARRRQIEGEVLLEVLFRTTGEITVTNVIRGLGYGLDEAAIEAAQGIRFRPAMRAGENVDSQATVHIVFQLAY